jgi:cation transport regulator ChaC
MKRFVVEEIIEGVWWYIHDTQNNTDVKTFDDREEAYKQCYIYNLIENELDISTRLKEVVYYGIN